MNRLTRTYLSSKDTKTHVRCWSSLLDDRTTLICFPPVPYTGIFFDTFAKQMECEVLCPDLPGYGQSDFLSSDPTIESYVKRLNVCLNQADESPKYLLGFHSGALVAAEMALKYPDLVAGLILIDVPLFSEDQRITLKTTLTTPPDYAKNREKLSQLWETQVLERMGVIPYERALDLYLDFISAGERVNHGFHAATSYVGEKRFSQLTHPTKIVATNSSLRDGTLRAADLVSGSLLEELPEITAPAFELGAKSIAKITAQFMQRAS